ncbi:P-II family nitrogen regulator [Desulfotomaculum sp. 1211_IL3151]|uniref:P-II family nitrogen regulator n=1 Tax=Desulfotomaculum sp. 1211_IL3151 TaxID=3084055 RepID=UPI002FD97BB9
MAESSETRLEALITIVDFSLGKALSNLFKNNNIPIAILIHGYGTAKSVIYDILGYGSPKKIVTVSIQTKNMSKSIMNQIHNRLDFSKPGTGIAFTISVSSISNTLSMICKQADEYLKIGSEGMTVKPKEPYHLIITIVNSGYFEQVMEAAKKAGATGGTLIHARGLGSKEAIKYLGITIQPEKDIILILTSQEKKLAIMGNIMQDVGLNKAGMGICFSLPVNSAMGLGTRIENVDEL